MNNTHPLPSLRQNWKQFTLLVIVNAFVGGMVGMERSIFPEFAREAFGIASHTAILSFITAFGITKAITNYVTGKVANRVGRRNLLLTGWLFAIPVPLMLLYAGNWNLVIVANILLGISQGLTWSSTVVMKIDLVGEKDRGLAMGLNEFAGYLAVGVVAFLSGYLAHRYGIRPYPFVMGEIIALAGLALTALWVKDTMRIVRKESGMDETRQLDQVFLQTTLTDKTLSTVTQAGLINNLNDGMIWGLLPIFLFSLHFDVGQIGIITAVYPAVWGIGQLFTGRMGDLYSKKALLFWGMLLQGLAILCIPLCKDYTLLVLLSVVLGLGTALVYPTFLSTIAQATSPRQRAESIGTFRLWRDLGYAIGAIVSGVVADRFGITAAICVVGGLTIFSSLVIQIRMPVSIKSIRQCIELQELEAVLARSRKVQVIDVRSDEEFNEGHIPQAMHIAIGELASQRNRLDKHFQLVTVSTKGGGRSSEGAKLLREMGFNAIWLCGGNEKWKEEHEEDRKV